MFRRTTGVLWRAAADRVVARWCPGEGAGAKAHEVSGWAAFVWMALHSPRPFAELYEEFENSGCAEPADELRVSISLLLDHYLIEKVESQNG